MNNYKFYIYGKNGCGYFNNSINLLKSLDNDDVNIISLNTISELKYQINQDFNINEFLLNINKYNDHKTSPMIFYGNNEKLLFIGGNDNLNDLIQIIRDNKKQIINKMNELYGGDDIITSLSNDLS
jgi:hypothetical protein